MRPTLLIASLVALFAEPSAAVEFGGDADVRAFLIARFVALGADVASARVAIAHTDLNGDRRRDALAYVSGSAWCGSGGCRLYVLENRGRAYRVVARTTSTRPPIRVLERRTNGWRDLSVFVAGGGIRPGYDAVLRFDGWKYPGNPSQPTRRALGDEPGAIAVEADTPSEPL